MNSVENFVLEKDRYLFFDIFHKNNKLILICPVYVNGINIKNLHISNNNIELKLCEKYSKIEYEPIEILIYDFISDSSVNTITVKYGEITKDYTLTHIKSEITGKLAVSTLFKDDYTLIDVFYNYYIKQGVTKFYMYYNGKLTEDIISKYNLPGITLVEWDFHYWNNGCRFIHHAQLGQIHHAIYKYGKDVNEYMILCDLDEYLYIPKTSLIDYFEKHSNIDVFGFKNCWADTHEGIILDTIPTHIKCSDNILPFGERSKCVYKTSAIATVGIHTYKDFLYRHTISHENIMFHFYKWSGKARNVNVNKSITLELL
jgi:hypothetical protein